jgi:hypothetical protein
MNNPFRTPSPPDVPPRPVSGTECFMRGIAYAAAVAIVGGLIHRAAPYLHANVIGFIAAALVVVTFGVRALETEGSYR